MSRPIFEVGESVVVFKPSKDPRYEDRMLYSTGEIVSYSKEPLVVFECGSICSFSHHYLVPIDPKKDLDKEIAELDLKYHRMCGGLARDIFVVNPKMSVRDARARAREFYEGDYRTELLRLKTKVK